MPVPSAVRTLSILSGEGVDARRRRRVTGPSSPCDAKTIRDAAFPLHAAVGRQGVRGEYHVTMGSNRWRRAVDPDVPWKADDAAAVRRGGELRREDRLLLRRRTSTTIFLVRGGDWLCDDIDVMSYRRALIRPGGGERGVGAVADADNPYLAVIVNGAEDALLIVHRAILVVGGVNPWWMRA